MTCMLGKKKYPDINHGKISTRSLKQRNKIGKINDTRIYVENFFIGEKPWANQDKIYHVINLYNYIDFHHLL